MALSAASKISAADAYKLAASPASAADVNHNVTPEPMGIPANKLWLWGAALAVVIAAIIFTIMYF